MDVWDYFDQREREHKSLSIEPDPDLQPIYLAFEGSDGKRGRLFARLVMSDRAFLSIAERLVVEDGYVHRQEYAYYLIIDEAEVWARERDPSHDPAEHGHGRDHVREDAGPITFRAFVERCWDILSDEPDPELEASAK